MVLFAFDLIPFELVVAAAAIAIVVVVTVIVVVAAVIVAVVVVSEVAVDAIDTAVVINHMKVSMDDHYFHPPMMATQILNLYLTV